MIESSTSGFQRQIPASRAFDTGQAPNNPANTPQVNEAPQAPQSSNQATVSPSRTEEINTQTALSRDTTRIDPSQVSNNSQQRGANLDITV